MTQEGLLSQGQPLSAIGLPDYMAEGTSPFQTGQCGVKAITVLQLRGPMGFYDVAVVEFDDSRSPQIHPLHQCDFIAI